MTDIWDEKPKTFPNNEYDWPIYDGPDMDAWLEKLKTEYHKAVTAVDYLTKVALKTGKKLKDIEDLVDEDDEAHFVGGYLGLEIRKVLEGRI